MLIKCKYTIVSSGVTNPAGSIIDLEEKEAHKLVKMGYASLYSQESKPAEQVAPPALEVAEEEEVDSDLVSLLSSIKGVSDEVAQGMVDAGIDSLETLQSMTSDELYELDIRGIGRKNSSDIITNASVM